MIWSLLDIKHVICKLFIILIQIKIIFHVIRLGKKKDYFVFDNGVKVS